jgi:hypothetical protein
VSSVELHGGGPCARCGHDPACGFAQVNDDWLCHTDDHTCYATGGVVSPSMQITLHEAVPDGCVFIIPPGWDPLDHNSPQPRKFTIAAPAPIPTKEAETP